MAKKSVVGIVVLIVGLGLGGYWLYGQRTADGPAIATLPPAQALGFLNCQIPRQLITMASDSGVAAIHPSMVAWEALTEVKGQRSLIQTASTA